MILEKSQGIEYIMLLIMKQKTRFRKFGNTGYRPQKSRIG